MFDIQRHFREKLAIESVNSTYSWIPKIALQLSLIFARKEHHGFLRSLWSLPTFDFAYFGCASERRNTNHTAMFLRELLVLYVDKFLNESSLIRNRRPRPFSFESREPRREGASNRKTFEILRVALRSATIPENPSDWAHLWRLFGDIPSLEEAKFPHLVWGEFAPSQGSLTSLYASRKKSLRS